MAAGARHRFDVLRQPIPKEERCTGQIVNSAKSRGSENTEARAKISSTSVLTSSIPTLRMCLDISLSQEDNGTTISFGYLLSKPQTLPVIFLNEQVTSMF